VRASLLYRAAGDANLVRDAAQKALALDADWGTAHPETAHALIAHASLVLNDWSTAQTEGGKCKDFPAHAGVCRLLHEKTGFVHPVSSANLSSTSGASCAALDPLPADQNPAHRLAFLSAQLLSMGSYAEASARASDCVAWATTGLPPTQEETVNGLTSISFDGNCVPYAPADPATLGKCVSVQEAVRKQVNPPTPKPPIPQSPGVADSDLVFGLTLNWNIALGGGMGASISRVWDFEGNRGWAITTYPVTGAIVSGGVGGFVASAKTIYDLQGPGVTFGTSGGDLFGGGVDFFSTDEESYIGFSLWGGFGEGWSGSWATTSYTWVDSGDLFPGWGF
jgi:hypothetical protein